MGLSLNSSIVLDDPNLPADLIVLIVFLWEQFRKQVEHFAIESLSRNAPS